MISGCNTLSNNKLIPVEENRRKFILNNTSRFYINKVLVDNCYITSGLCSDYLFEIFDTSLPIPVSSPKYVYYVELKGCNIEHAFKQLETVVISCKGIHSLSEKTCYIVASKVPKAGPGSQVLKKKFFRKHQILLDISTNITKVTI